MDTDHEATGAGAADHLLDGIEAAVDAVVRFLEGVGEWIGSLLQELIDPTSEIHKKLVAFLEEVTVERLTAAMEWAEDNYRPVLP